VEEIPSDPQIRNLVDPLSSQYFQEDFWFLPGELKEQKGLWQFQNELNTHSIALEGAASFLRRKSPAALFSLCKGDFPINKRPKFTFLAPSPGQALIVEHNARKYPRKYHSKDTKD
jgi:hypothetical protein